MTKYGWTTSKNLSSISKTFEEKVKEINLKVKQLEDNLDYTTFSALDFRITIDEINKAISKLKNGKSPGLDNIKNEMLKAAQVYINPCFLKLFNAILTSGFYPMAWSKGYITPIFKSDNPKLPKNYRGITICSSIGKVFNTILNNRLDKYLTENNIIHENQIGFL